MALSDRELGYIAGVVDAMATLRVRDVRGTELPFVEINCPNLSLLEWLGGKTGTGVTKTKRDYKRMGCSQHCTEAHVHIVSLSGRWSVSGARATVLLHNVLPFLQLQVETAQQLLDVGLSCGRKLATPAKMAALGWDVPDFVRVVHPAHTTPHLQAVGR